MKKTFILSIVFVALSLVLVNEVSACKCALQDAKERFTSAENVFLGKVLSVEPKGDGLSAELEVLDSWKGVDKRRITVTTLTSDGASCGENFVVGDKKLFWINGSTAHSCDSAVKDADEFLRDKPKLKIGGADPSGLTNGDSGSQQNSNDSDSSANSDESSFVSRNFLIFIVGFLIIDTVVIGFFLLMRSRKRT